MEEARWVVLAAPRWGCVTAVGQLVGWGEGIWVVCGCVCAGVF